MINQLSINSTTDVSFLFWITLAAIIAGIIGCLRFLQKQVRRNLYSYRVMLAIAVVFFLFISGIIFVCFLGPYLGNMPLYNYYGGIVSSFWLFSVLTFPIVAIFAVILLVSNLILIVRMGRSLTNILGILTGATLITLVIIGVNLYDVLDGVIDVHSYGGHHISLFAENIFFIVATYFECVLAASIICTIIAARHEPKHDKDYAIILGCYPGPNLELAPILRKRVERARKFAILEKRKTGKQLALVPSGGQGTDEDRSEALAMSQYLERHPVEGIRVLNEDQSKNTWQNMEFSKQIIFKDWKKQGKTNDPKVAFVTTGYHVFRSGVIAKAVGLNAEGIGAQTKWYFYVNASLREFFANLKSQWPAHLFNVILLNLTLAAILLFSYFNNIL